MLTIYNHIHTDTIEKPMVLMSHALKYPKNAKALRPGKTPLSKTIQTTKMRMTHAFWVGG